HRSFLPPHARTKRGGHRAGRKGGVLWRPVPVLREALALTLVPALPCPALPALPCPPVYHSLALLCFALLACLLLLLRLRLPPLAGAFSLWLLCAASAPALVRVRVWVALAALAAAAPAPAPAPRPVCAGVEGGPSRTLLGMDSSTTLHPPRLYT
ncbi:hypothetical protein B0J11DRAFT_286187, partial [Dendryphion nanum]